MKRLLPLLAVLAISVAALMWYAAQEGEQGESIASAPETPAEDRVLDPAQLVAEPTGSSVPAPAEVPVEDSDRQVVPDEDQGFMGETFSLAGLVDLSAACGLDAGLEVLALRKAMSHGEFLRSALVNGRDRRILARSEVEADGGFELDLPMDAAAAHLLVIGEHLFTERTWDSELADQATATPPLLHPSAGASIRGRLIPPAPPGAVAASDASPGADLGGIEITLNPELSTFSTTSGAVIPMVRQTTETATDGTFAFRAVPTGLKYTIHAQPEDLAGFEGTMEDLAPCEQRAVDFPLSAGATLAGHVRDDAGEPVAGVRVEARLPGRWFGLGGRPMRREKTGEDGSFRLAAVAPGEIQLHAELDGYLEAAGKSFTLADGDVLTDLVITLDSGGVLAGRVIWDDGTPAATATVDVSFDLAHMAGLGAFNALKGSDGSDTCGEDGSFRVTGLGKGPFIVLASAPSRGETAVPTAPDRDGVEVEEPAMWRVRLTGVKPGNEQLLLELEEPRFLTGRVVDGAGEPVTVFEVSALRVVEGPMGMVGQPATSEEFEDDSGAFSLAGLTSGIWNVTVSAGGYGTVETTGLSFPPEEGGEPLLIVIQAEAVVEGTVFGPSGEPAGEAIVEVDTGEPGWQRATQGGTEPPQATTAKDGSYHLSGLTPGSVTLYAHGKDYARGAPVTLDLSVGGLRRNVNLHVLEGGTLTGIIYREDGEPAVDRMITVTNMGTFATSVTQSDRRGEFRIEHLDPGKLQVVAIDRGMDMAEFSGDGEDGAAMGGLLSSMKMTMVEIVDGEETHVELGAPPADPVRVSGQVTHAGEPYVGANITFYSGGGNLMERMRMCSVDKEGHYEAVLDSPGFYMVAVQKIHGGPGQQTSVEFRREIPKQDEVRLDFAIPEGRISGRVLDPDGNPASGARVTLTIDGPMKSGLMMGGQYSENAADAEGRFDIPGLRPGTYTIAVGGMPMGGMFGGAAKFSRVARNGLKVDEGVWLSNVDFRLEDPGAIEVTVLDDSRRPVAGASIFVRDGDGMLLERFSMSQTDARGRFRYGGISPGQYTVSARSVTEASAESPVLSVGVGKTVEASLSLGSGTLLKITLQDREGNPVDASISVIDSEGRDVNGMMGLSQIMDIYGDGGLGFATHRVGPLAPGTYRVLAEDEQGRNANKPVRLSGQSERKITLRLK